MFLVQRRMCLGPSDTQSMRKIDTHTGAQANGSGQNPQEISGNQRQRELLAMRTLPPVPEGPPEGAEARVKDS